MRKPDEPSRPSAASRKFLGFVTGLLIFLLLLILGRIWTSSNTHTDECSEEEGISAFFGYRPFLGGYPVMA
jgi:hypothetical protein